MRIETNFKSPKSPKDCFKFIAEDFFKNHQKWDPDLLENTKLSTGPIGKGTTGRSVTKFGGKQVSQFEVTNFSAPKQFAFVNTTGAVNLNRVYSFKPADDGGTDINFVFEMSPKRPDTWLAFPILAAMTRGKVAKNIKTLEELLK
jgi:hypothetical protein